MTSILPNAVAAPPSVRPLHRLTVDQYHRMIAAGVLREDDRVELLEGLLVDKMTHNPPHDATVWLVQTVLLPLLPPEWILRIQSAITLGDSEPEPDLAVARGPGTRYVRSHPRPRDLALVVEVADTTLEEDRGTKARVYARARVPQYWIVNIPEAKVEVYTEPRAGRAPGYRQRQDHGVGDMLSLALLDRQVAQVPVRGLLPHGS